MRITWFWVTSSGGGIEGMLPFPFTHEAGSIPALTFRPGNLILFLHAQVLITSGSKCNLRLNRYQFLTATFSWAPGATAQRSSQLASSAWQLHVLYEWLRVPGRKASSDVCICLFGTVVHSADGVQNVVYLAHNQGITGAGSLRVVLVYRRFDSVHQH